MDAKHYHPVNLRDHITAMMRPLGILMLPIIKELPEVGKNDYELMKQECFISSDAAQATINLQYKIATAPYKDWTVEVIGYNKRRASGDDERYIIVCKDQAGKMQDYYYKGAPTESPVRTKDKDFEFIQKHKLDLDTPSPTQRYEECLANVCNNLPVIPTSTDINSIANLQQRLLAEAATTADLAYFQAVTKTVDQVHSHATHGHKNPAEYAKPAANSLKVLLDNFGKDTPHALKVTINAALPLIQKTAGIQHENSY